MIYDRDKLWSDLAKEDLEEIRKKYQMGVYAPRGKAELVKAFIEKADADLDRISSAVPPEVPADAFGRDLAAEEEAFRADLDQAGLDLVRMWQSRAQVQHNP